ncbi:SRPBCC family protein [Xanthobacter pseudotagetidis]|uniref:SRPBCC family protein n=1 Tax=Xanthobacter pseudotagetidis TaxID=3119911 RepID=UPI00372B28CD
MALEMTGQCAIACPRERVYAALNDEAVLKACIAGCEEIERLSDDTMRAAVVAKVGPVKAKFRGKVTLSDREPPSRYRITGEGDGGIAGFAKGSALVTLADLPEGGTRLSYQVEAQIGGKLAQLGQRLVAGTAKQQADLFFANLVRYLDAPPAE